MAGDLWIYGGVSSDVWLHGTITAPHTGADCHLMKLSKHTHHWEPVSPPEGVSREPSYHAAGVVHHDKLYLPMRPFPNLQGLTDGMRIFEPVRQEWTVLSVNVWPTAWAKQLLAATEDYLVQFGGINVASDIVSPEEALWTWDINNHTWQQMHPTGDIPAPDAAFGLAVANGRAYLLVREANTRHVGVYELDLQQWHWRKLPLEGQSPRFNQSLVPVVVQNKWLMVAGEDAYPNQAGSGLAIFDFETLAWNQSDTSGDAFQQRRNCYVATCHDNAMVIMGGLESPVGSARPRDAWPAKGALCIRQQATVPAVDASDLSCSRYDIGADINTIFQEELFPDATVAAQGRVWHVHRAILASASPILKEAFLCGNATELVFEDITADGMGLLLNWLYARFKASLTLSQAETLFKLSHRFDIVKLQHQCEQTLKASVGMEALPQLEDLADSFHCMELKEACQRFRTLLDEDGLQQLDERLACYAAAQGVQDPICRAQMPAQAGPSCFQPQDQEDVEPWPGSMCHVDDATQNITGEFGQDVVETSEHALISSGEKGSRHVDGGTAQETMLVDSQPPTEDDRTAVIIVHGAETPGSPASHKDNEFLDHESPRSVFVTDGYQGLTTCSDSSSSDGSGGAEEISTSDIMSPQPSAAQDVIHQALWEVVSEADEAPASSSATAASHSQESAGSSQESRLQPHGVEHVLPDSPVQADDPTSAESSGTTCEDIMEAPGCSATTELFPSTSTPQDEVPMLHQQPSEDAPVLQVEILPKAQAAASPSGGAVTFPGFTTDSGDDSMDHQFTSTEAVLEAARAAGECTAAGQDQGDISQEGLSASTHPDAESSSLPPLSMSQRALVAAGLVALGGLLAAVATVMVGAAAVNKLPRPRIPSFSLW
ncbi:TPA: hypothetical protein ACH3X2_003581 [Trebouxia sp. C0005]|nr:MAG: hypothetical protein FRX49_06971 [Trebouxia sp. A1-2]